MELVLLLPLVAIAGHSHQFSAHSQIIKSPLSSFFFKFFFVFATQHAES